MELINQNQNSISWLEKYRPKTLSEYYMSRKNLDIVKSWIKDFRKNDPDAKQFLILHGTAGIGKTTLAHLILNHNNYEIIECNASDTRTKKTISESLGQISKSTVCTDDKGNFKSLAIIMDEIDGLASGESASVQELIDIVTKDKDSKKATKLCPVICTSNSIKDKKLAPLLKLGTVLNIGKPSINDCGKLIDRIAKAEEFTIDTITKNNIIEQASGDYRQIIMQLLDYYYLMKNKSLPDSNELALVKTDQHHSPQQQKQQHQTSISINIMDDDDNQYKTIKLINHLCETPLEKINYFLNHKSKLEDIRYICSDDSNLYFMNFYINVIPIIASIQTKSNLATNKENLLKFFNLLDRIYKCLVHVDLMNNTIFLDKKWDLLDYFDIVGLAKPLSILNRINTKQNVDPPSYIVPYFNLTHHTPYNFMRQEQSISGKKIGIDYVVTKENNMTNIYYNLKRFKHMNIDKVKKYELSSSKKKPQANSPESKYYIDRTYLKMVEKIDELLR